MYRSIKTKYQDKLLLKHFRRNHDILIGFDDSILCSVNVLERCYQVITTRFSVIVYCVHRSKLWPSRDGQREKFVSGQSLIKRKYQSKYQNLHLLIQHRLSLRLKVRYNDTKLSCGFYQLFKLCLKITK